MVEELHVPITVMVSVTSLPQDAGRRLQVERVTIAPSFPTDEPLRQHLALVLQAALEGESVARQLAGQPLAAVLEACFRGQDGVTRQSSGAVTGGLSPCKLQRTIAYIKDHLEQDLSLVTLAAVGQLSPAHFARLFKHATGLTPHQYVLKYRMERAQQLLTETEETLIDIGLQVGCADQSHFTALFHKHIGQTPKAYRDSLRS